MSTMKQIYIINFIISGFLVSFGGLFLLTIMFSRFLCIFYLILYVPPYPSPHLLRVSLCTLLILSSPLFSSLFSHSDYGSNQVYRREPTKERPGDRRTKAPEIDLIEGNQKKQNTTRQRKLKI